MAAVVDATVARAWIGAIAAAIDAEAEALTRLDAAVGDGDHGTNMARGFAAAVGALPDEGGPGDVLFRAGGALISKVGGASGPLFGSAFRAIGRALPGESATAGELGAALAAGLAVLRKLGGAAPGDKTIVDAYDPAVAAFESAVAGGSSLPEAATAAAAAAREGVRATVELRARKGRASYLGERSVGHQDPGATSTWLMFRALAEVTAPR